MISKTESSKLLSSQKFLAAKKEILAAIAEAGTHLRQLRPSSSDAREAYGAAIRDFCRERGRDLR